MKLKTQQWHSWILVIKGVVMLTKFCIAADRKSLATTCKDNLSSHHDNDPQKRIFRQWILENPLHLSRIWYQIRYHILIQFLFYRSNREFPRILVAIEAGEFWSLKHRQTVGKFFYIRNRWIRKHSQNVVQRFFEGSIEKFCKKTFSEIFIFFFHLWKPM